MLFFWYCTFKFLKIFYMFHQFISICLKSAKNSLQTSFSWKMLFPFSEHFPIFVLYASKHETESQINNYINVSLMFWQSSESSFPRMLLNFTRNELTTEKFNLPHPTWAWLSVKSQLSIVVKIIQGE